MTEHTADRQLRERARAVIPNGMYGHQSASGAEYPQFFVTARGAALGRRRNQYLDLMCGYGPACSATAPGDRGGRGARRPG